MDDDIVIGGRTEPRIGLTKRSKLEESARLRGTITPDTVGETALGAASRGGTVEGAVRGEIIGGGTVDRGDAITGGDALSRAFVAPWAAAVSGIIAAVLVIESSFFVERKLRIDDPVGAR